MTSPDQHYLDQTDKAMLKWKNKSSCYFEWFDYDAFAIFLGDPNQPDNQQRMYRVNIHNPEIRRLIDMINGPYGETILKILEIKRANHELPQPNR